MPKMEGIPAEPPLEGPPEGPNAEQAVDNGERAAESMARLHAFLMRWRKTWLAGAALSAAVSVMDAQGASAKRKGDKEVSEAALGVEMDAAELRALDPEATPERLRFILDTLPAGFVEGDLAAIEFVDEDMTMPEAYGLSGVKRAHAGEGIGADGVRVVFFRGSRGETSRELWADVMIHEIAHANDWIRDGRMSELERASLKLEVVARVMAEDRHRSSYVESIKNPDPQTELEFRAVEYWAEINEAYLQGEPLPAADEALVKKHIAAKDPSFDRDAALKRRNDALNAMTYEEARGDASDPEIGGDPRAWVEGRLTRVGLEELDAARQRIGRLELVQAMREHGARPERRQFIEYVMEYYEAREDLLEALRDPKGPRVVDAAYREMGRASGRLDRMLDLADEEDLTALEEIDRIVAGHDLVIGEHRGARMEMDESGQLFPDGPTSDANEWIFFAAGWETGPPDYQAQGPEMILRDLEWEEADEEDDDAEGADEEAGTEE